MIGVHERYADSVGSFCVRFSVVLAVSAAAWGALADVVAGFVAAAVLAAFILGSGSLVVGLILLLTWADSHVAIGEVHKHYLRALEARSVEYVSVPDQEHELPWRVGPSDVRSLSVGGAKRFTDRDIKAFVKRSFELGRFGTSERNWVGQRLPDWGELQGIDDWRQLQRVLESRGVLQNVGREKVCATFMQATPEGVLSAMAIPVTVD